MNLIFHLCFLILTLAKIYYAEKQAASYLLIGGYESAPPYAPKDTILRFKPHQKSIEVVGTHLVHGRMSGQMAGVYKRKLIVHGGLAPDYKDIYTEISEKNVGIVSAIENDVPFGMEDSSNPLSHRFLGCGGVLNDEFHVCFGFRGGEPQPDSYPACTIHSLDHMGQNITREIPLIVQTFTSMACLWTKDAKSMYVLGGQPMQGNSSAFKMNLDTGDVTELESKSIYEFHRAAAVWYQGDIVVCGGYETRNGTNYVVSTCDRYNIESNAWEEFPSMIEARHNHNLVNWAGDRILAIGGQGSMWNTLSSIELYENGEWKGFMQLPFPLQLAAVVELS